MYTKKTLNRFQKPKFAREMKNADAIGKVGNMKCGDVMKIYLKLENKLEKNKEKKGANAIKEVIKDISFQTYGCVAAIACSDALCELAKGKTIKQAEKITFKDIIDELGELPPIKYHCAVLGIEALKEAIKSHNANLRKKK